MAKGRYYTPTPIVPWPGVVRRQLDERADMFEGNADALVQCGLLRADMLPGQYSISWRPEGMERGAGSWIDVPRYLTICRRPNGDLRVRFVVSLEEQSIRAAEARRLEQEHRRKLDAAAQAEREWERPSAGSKRLVGFEVMRRLAAIESLCRYSQAAVRLKTGDSSKLARADEDLEAAVSALVELRDDIAAHDPLSQDKVALGLAASGRMAAENYMRCAKSTPRTSAGDSEDD